MLDSITVSDRKRGVGDLFCPRGIGTDGVHLRVDHV